MIKKKLLNNLIIRHFFFIFSQIFKILKYRQEGLSEKKFLFLLKLNLLLFEPYYLHLKKIIIKEKKYFFKLKITENIDQNGYSMMPKIDTNSIDFIKFNDNNDRLITYNKIDLKLGLKFAENNGFHKITRDYFKEDFSNFTIVSWNTKSFEEEFGSTSWHQDRDGFKILKFFIYLDDVNQEAGPHQFICKSHKNQFLRFLPLLRYEDSEIKKYYSDIVEFTGEKGMCFAENTRGLHRGTPPKKKIRSILQFEYYTGPIKWTEDTINIKLD